MNYLFFLWKRGLRQWCSFNGRTSRPEFYAMLSLLLLAYLLPAITFFASGMSEQEQTLYAAVLSLNSGADTKGFILLWIIGAWQSLVFLMTLAVGCRRLHDIGASGWWQILLFASFSINTVSYNPFFIIFSLVVWSRPTQSFSNKYGDVPSLNAPIPPVSRKSCIFTFFYLLITCGSLTSVTPPFSNNQTLSSKKVLSGWTYAAIPTKHTYLLQGTATTFDSLFPRPQDWRNKEKNKPSYTIFRFIKNSPVAYGIVQEGGKNQYFLSDNPAHLQQTLPWYLRFFIPESRTSSLLMADAPSGLSLNAKNRYNISCPVEELEHLLENYIKSEGKTKKNSSSPFSNLRF